MNNRQIARQYVKRHFGNHPLIAYTYAAGSRTVRDFLESVVENDLAGNRNEADFWANELKILVPEFNESYRAFP